ncbi:hypothetical protein BC937DRAFT_90712 [Endogone sp. FLAS-F59071]|nr:hypothetical protein BC937DRAFT_90712 [Endogone sp. FLAS-F59071]|eukprot:RUS21992.1 hypothetical protein BC937DRAFT_90712 [Endogone sp. FLAS-F59071]
MLQFFAACNPYRLRDQTKTGVAGLSLQDKRYEEHSPLVYQVLPLPQTLIDYVWSFGTLQPKDEEACINVMVKSKHLPLFFAELIFQSQQFMREMDGPFSVSLRDVKRTLQLFAFFLNSLQARYNLSSSNYPPSNEAFSWPLRAVVLALALAYQARMFDQSQRLKYRQLMCSILQSHRHYVTDKIFQQILREEEEDYLKKMTAPPSVAWNEALLENTLTMIVCILTQIPLFLIGAPGSSKSLAVRLIHQNLKGSDSIDPYFRTLPQIYIIPHQGSSSSTSEGITKVFETANKYQKMNSKAFPLQTVVLLDEIGLAEGSPFNPLKVLHYLLEPSYPSKSPIVSVIGISNWRLDLSKTSRALLVQRPQLSLEDLVDTAMRVAWNDQIVFGPQKLQLQRIAQAYIEYEKAQKHTNFHGLRDYYAFVKALGKYGGSLSPSTLHFALARNFGGLDDKEPLWCRFSPIIYDIPGDQIGYQDISVLDVITSNLKDTIEGRHLMVIGNTGVVVGILQHVMTSQGLDPVVIYGSQLPDDQMTNDYSYGVLNKILMCVESGRPLILSNLNILYGSLYDLWNQNYMAVGSKDDTKYYCRVALGEYANPMCYVHPRFRSILVMDENEVQFADPPLLNRFEKQRLSLNDILEQTLTSVVEELALWTQRISIPVDSPSSSYALEDSERTLEKAAGSFTVEDMFVGFDKQVTLASLVIYNSTKQDSSILLDVCKADLINMACSDAIIRSGDSILAIIDPQEVAHWKDVYFNRQQHDNLRSYITALLSKDFLSSQLMMITTLSNVNVDISACLEDLLQCQVDKLSTFKSEAQLTNRLKMFWNEPSKELLILQCDGQNTSEGVLKLAKYIIELQQREYLAGFKISHATSNYSATEYAQIDCPDGGRVPTKHVIIVLHVHRGTKGTGSRLTQFDFLSGWSQVVIETLEQQPRPLSQLLEGSMRELIQTLYPFEDIFWREISWCLVSMKYPASIKGLEHLKTLIQRMPSCGRLIRSIHRRVNEWLNEYEQPNWQLMIARSKQMLLLSATFHVALDRHIRNTVRIPIAKIICSLEHLSALTTYLDLNEQYPLDNDSTVATDNARSTSNSELLEFWEKIFEDKTVVSIEHLADPGPDAYSISSVNIVQLQFPFSKYFADQIDSYRQIFQEEFDTWKEDDANLDPKTGDIYPRVLENHFLLFSKSIETKIRHIRSIAFRNYVELYFEDYMRLILLGLGDVNEQHQQILKHIFEGRIKQHVSDPIRLHIEWWKNNVVILAELELILLCGADIFQSKDFMESAEFNGNNDFEEWLMNACSDRLLQALLTEKRKDFDSSRWCQNAATLLSFCFTINSSSLSPMSPRLQFLRVLNDFVSKLVVSLDFPLSKLRDAIIDARSVDNEDFSATQNVFTDTFVFSMLDFVLSLAESKYGECKNMLWRTFLSCCLDALLPNSMIYVTLCQFIFSEANTNIPFLGPILLRILREEEQLHPGFARDLILLQKSSMTHENVEFAVAKPTLNEIIELNPRLYTINKGLTAAGLNSRLVALTCDVIQMEFFAPLDFDQLCVIFCNIKEAILTVGQLEVLQSIIVVAYLKEFTSSFRKRYVKELGSLESMTELDRATELLSEFKKTILDINNMFELNLQLPIVNSARIYFLKDLRTTMSMNDLRQFCSLHHRQFPWLATLEWGFTTGEERLPFNPFHYMPSYGEADLALANLANQNDAKPLQHLLSKAVNNIDERVTLLGSLAMGFQFKQATRNLNGVETQAATWIRDKLRSKQLEFNSEYRHLGVNLLANQHPLIQVSQNDSVPTLLMKSVVIHVIILHISMSADASPLAAYAHDVPEISQTYLLTCPSDSEAVVLKAIAQHFPLSRWSCQCGYHYIVGECGNTNQVGICPECKNEIGGLWHVAKKGNTKLDNFPIGPTGQLFSSRDQVGYILEDVTNTGSCGHDGYTVRSLCRAAYRILHLFVHALLPPSVVTGAEWQKYCLNHIENDWIQLKIILDCNDETLALILHAVVVNLRSLQLPPSQPIASSSQASPNLNAGLQTAELRDQWERAFDRHCVLPVTRDVHQKSVEFAQRIRFAVEPSPLDIVMNELEAFMSQEYIETHHPRLWRRIDLASFDGLIAYYWSDPVHQEKHRFLSIFFQHQERLGRIQYLIPIIKFVGIVSARLAHRLKRQEARSLTFRLFIEQQHDNQALEANFDQFAYAWNSIRSHITGYQCHDFESIPMIDREMPITFAILREEDESIYMLAVLDYLVNIQNDFLNETNNVMNDLHVERPTPGTSLGQPRYLRSVRLTDAHPAQVIVYEWDPAILQYSQRSTNLGMGSALAYDLAKIEGELVHQLVFDKTHLEFEWEPFAFHLELFHGGADILADVAAIVEQEPVSADTAAVICADRLVIEQASEILSDLELLLSFIKRTGIASVGHSNTISSSDGTSAMLIIDYCKQWVKLSVLLGKSFQQTVLATMQLKHTVGLYEIVEEMVSDVLLQFLAPKYKQPLSPSVEKELTDALDWRNVELALGPDSSVAGGQRGEGGRIPARAFATALKRFMTRYISVGQGDVRADTQLMYYLGDPVRFWPLSGISEMVKKDLTRVLEESFPESLMVSHTHAAYGFITTQLERLADSYYTRPETQSFTTPSLFGNPAMPEASHSRLLHRI